MAIRKRGATWAIDVSRDGRRLTATCAGKRAAKAKEAELLQELVAGAGTRPAYTARVVWGLGEAWDRTYEVAWMDGPSDAAMVAMRAHLYSYWGKQMPLSAITTDLVDTWIVDLRKRGNSGATINRKLAALSKVTRVASARPERSGYAPANRPTFTRQKEAEGRIREISQDEEHTLLGLLEQWGALDQRDAVIVLLDTGMRCGELWRVEGRDVDLFRGLIRIWKTKTSRPRTVPMTKRVRAAMEGHMNHINMGPLFPFRNDWLRAPWQRARFMMGLNDDPLFVPHILRHSCACRLVQRGVGLEVVRDWLGHKSLAMTLRYARLTPKNLLDAVSVLEQ